MIAIIILVALVSLFRVYAKSLWSIALVLVNHHIHRLRHHDTAAKALALEEVKVDDGLRHEYCIVCLCQISPRERYKSLQHCNHVFHVHCIDAWLQHHSTCPLCRSPVTHTTLSRANTTLKEPFSVFGALHYHFLSTFDKFCQWMTDPLSQELMLALCADCNYL